MSHQSLLGQTFERLTVVAQCATRPAGRSSSARVWQCQCLCGQTVRVDTKSLRSGNTKSCGCLQRDKVRLRNARHGLAVRGNIDPLYNTWLMVIRRCYSKSNPAYPDYGGRGISVCDRWRHGESGATGFECFKRDMGERPPGKTIDRQDNDGNYEPSNCRWATPAEQLANRRCTVNRAAIREMLGNGKSVAQIRTALGCGTTVIYKVRAEMRKQ